MILYHGTADVYLPSILKEGLKPNPDNVWKAKWPSGDTIVSTEEQGVVYLTTKKADAQMMADARASYLKTDRGGKFLFTAKPDPFVVSFIGFKKDEDAPVVKTAKPVILRIEVESKIFLKPDPHFDSGKGTGFMYKGFIPPEKISVLTKNSR